MINTCYLFVVNELYDVNWLQEEVCSTNRDLVTLLVKKFQEGLMLHILEKLLSKYKRDVFQLF